MSNLFRNLSYQQHFWNFDLLDIYLYEYTWKVRYFFFQKVHNLALKTAFNNVFCHFLTNTLITKQLVPAVVNICSISSLPSLLLCWQNRTTHVKPAVTCCCLSLIISRVDVRGKTSVSLTFKGFIHSEKSMCSAWDRCVQNSLSLVMEICLLEVFIYCVLPLLKTPKYVDLY